MILADTCSQFRQAQDFITQQGLFKWCVVPFRLSNMPSVFSSMVARVLLQCNRCAVWFIDDILVDRVVGRARRGLTHTGWLHGRDTSYALCPQMGS